MRKESNGIWATWQLCDDLPLSWSDHTESTSLLDDFGTPCLYSYLFNEDCDTIFYS